MPASSEGHQILGHVRSIQNNHLATTYILTVDYIRSTTILINILSNSNTRREIVITIIIRKKERKNRKLEYNITRYIMIEINNT